MDCTNQDVDCHGGRLAMMKKAAETMTKALTPGQAVAEEHLLVYTMGMMTTEEVVAAMKTGMTHGTVVHGAPEMITLGMIIGMMTDPNPPHRPN